MSKIRDTDDLTISARVRAMENRLVTRERMERMVEARSDDEAVKVLAECGYEELPALTNLGTSFGMGMIITTYMIGLQGPGGADFIKAALIGNLGAIVGSIVSVRLMLHFTKKRYGTEEYCHCDGDEVVDIRKYRKVREGNISARFMQAMLDGGNSGVQMGLTIIPGVLIICTMVLMLTNGAGAGAPTRGRPTRGSRFFPGWARSSIRC